VPGTRIFVGYHKPYQTLEGDVFVPLHMGRAVALAPTKDGRPISEADAAWLLEHTVGDDTGDSISARNRNYNELTGIYWAWRNYELIGDPDHIGFMQYRRHLIFEESRYDDAERSVDELAYAKVDVGSIYPGYQDEFGLTDERVAEHVARFDVILPKRCDLSHYVRSIREDFLQRIPGTHAKDLELLRRAVRAVSPEHLATLDRRLAATDKRCYQSFVLSRAEFFAYCEYLFPILQAVDRELDTRHYTINGQRTLGYLGEILFDVYFDRLLKEREVSHVELGTTYLATPSIPEPIQPRTALVILAYADYESLEITLAAYGRLLAEGQKVFVLQNGRGTYDCERTYRVAKRYAALYPNHIEVVDDIPPQRPYKAISILLKSKRLEPYDYICKVDDDAFPIRSDWFERMCRTYDEQFARLGERLAYVSGLVNNNPFGFKQLIERVPALADEYFSTYARDHIAGWGYEGGTPAKSYPAWRVVPKDEIDDDVCGTIWRYPYIARWIHERTTMQPEQYLDLVADWGVASVGAKRYSINCMLFRKSYWDAIADPQSEFPEDDEFLSEQYCKRTGKEVVVDLGNPFVHLFFYTQREENKDMIPAVRERYQAYLGLPYPISLQPSRELELEGRVRFLEASRHHAGVPGRRGGLLGRLARRIWRHTPVGLKPALRSMLRGGRA